MTHLLQAMDRHAASGVMKAHWSAKDFVEMLFKPLPFTSRDAELIHAGLAVRARRMGQ